MAKLPVAAGIALALIAGSAVAADLPSRKGPAVYVPPPPAFSWTGLYGGVNIGYGFGAGGSESGGLFYPTAPLLGGAAWSNPHNLSGVLGGGQVGYNYQFSPWLTVGVEADIQAADINTQQNFAGPGASPVPAFANIAAVNSSKYVDWFGTVRGRVGVSLPSYPNLLVYGTAGFAYGQVNHNVSVANYFPNVAPFPAAIIGRGSYFNTNTGWTAGGGVEWSPLSFPAWSAKIEYLYTDLGSTTINFAGPLSNVAFNPVFSATHNSSTQFHTVRAGLNWHFNPFASAPVVAKY